MTDLVPLPRERFLAALRSEEIRFRSQGLYEAAVKIQRRADIVEQTGDYPTAPCYMDRGICEPPSCYIMDGLLCLPSSDGAVSLAFTEDRARYLFLALLAYLKVTPDDLRDLAFDLEEDPL